MIQLFGMPYAGGDAISLAVLAEYFPEEITFIPLDYAGHGSRRKEAYYNSFDEMAQDMAEQIKKNRNPECDLALLGYSMGSIVTYEMISKGYLEEKPKHLILCAHEAPGEQWHGAHYAQMSDLEFAHKLKELGGFQKFEDHLLDNKYFRLLYFNPIRVDYNLLASYTWSQRNPVGLSATIFHGSNDVLSEDICKWDKYLGVPAEYIQLGETHFFFQEYPKEFVECISRSLLK